MSNGVLAIKTENLIEKVMSIIEAISLFLIMLTLALIPSSSVALVVTRSVTHGIFNGVSVSLGIVVGDLIFILLSILGLSAVAETMEWLFLTIKYMGATYLIWLGYTLLTSKSTMPLTLDESKQKGSLIASFLAGLLLTLGDIKAIFFYVSLFPIFLNIKTLQFSDILIIMLVTIVAIGGIKISYAFSANKIARKSNWNNLEEKIKILAGIFMISSGCYLILNSLA
jgi:threonine/homoserine/homoserine lactone efflux protein